MIAFGLNISENMENEREKSFYPEWVRTEKLYNCENFSRVFSGRQQPLKQLFGIRLKK
ncbi:MAG TPA: hypothetical protein H9761_15945 [Candidatus Eisenbergiella merdavium]|uniref:Uncharacterized protein n=1 Tax=Candidatus Eisenbergiella merdavium TaxID=2838551 RepID=A0A9D2SR46_9FIRM|nr:hypothetical protein [Candidatus Eisenbergiella merdavium]